MVHILLNHTMNHMNLHLPFQECAAEPHLWRPRRPSGAVADGDQVGGRRGPRQGPMEGPTSKDYQGEIRGCKRYVLAKFSTFLAWYW